LTDVPDDGIVVRRPMGDPKINELKNDLATLAIEVREEFADLRAEMRAGFAQMHGGFAQMHGGFAQMHGGFAEMRVGFAAVNRRLDDLTDISHRIYHEHGQRLRDLEDHLTRNRRP
jgi:hypothetical protein